MSYPAAVVVSFYMLVLPITVAPNSFTRIAHSEAHGGSYYYLPVALLLLQHGYHNLCLSVKKNSTCTPHAGSFVHHDELLAIGQSSMDGSGDGVRARWMWRPKKKQSSNLLSRRVILDKEPTIGAMQPKCSFSPPSPSAHAASLG